MSEPIALRVNGAERRIEADPATPLLGILRNTLGLTGSHFGCGVNQCGACNVLIDGQAVAACDTPLWAAAGKDIVTVEGLAAEGTLNEVQRAFAKHHALQCGFCTPGILCSVTHFLRELPAPDERQVRDMLSGHICRCTGYASIVAAVLDAATALRKGP